MKISHFPYGWDENVACEPNYKGHDALRSLDVLDHGFVALRNLAGPTRRSGALVDADDRDPAQAARMSFNQMDLSRSRSQDLQLCDYLMRNWHTSPFEMIEVYLEMKMPIFVARQLVRHRTASLNEVSARYHQLPSDWYIPEQVGAAASNVKQGSVGFVDVDTSEFFKEALDRDCRTGYVHYLEAMERGIAAEEARMFLHLNHYTWWLWKQDLHNMMHLLRLRDHSHAQRQARCYAIAVDTLIRHYLPESMALYDKYRRQHD